MGETTFTFRVDADLKAAFAAIAKAKNETTAEMLRDCMRECVRRWENEHAGPDYDAWFRRQVQAALDDPRPAMPAEQVEAKFAAMRAAAHARLGTKPRRTRR